MGFRPRRLTLSASPPNLRRTLLLRLTSAIMSKPDTTPVTPGGNGAEPKLSRASVGRFSLYLRHLERFHRAGIQTVSSGQLGDALGITDAQVRKDLAYLGNLGQPGIGYPAQELIDALRHRLG